MGSMVRAGSEARPGSERRRTGSRFRQPDRTPFRPVLPAQSGLRPPFTTEERIRSCYNRSNIWKNQQMLRSALMNSPSIKMLRHRRISQKRSYEQEVPFFRFVLLKTQ